MFKQFAKIGLLVLVSMQANFIHADPLDTISCNNCANTLGAESVAIGYALQTGDQLPTLYIVRSFNLRKTWLVDVLSPTTAYAELISAGGNN